MKNKIKIIIDICMIFSLMILMNIRFTGMKLHEVLGITIFIIFIIHNLLNIKIIKSYFKNLFNKKLKTRYKVLFILDIILFIFMLGIFINGVLISNYLFKNILISNIGIYKKIHKFLSWWFLVLIAVHLGFHLNVIMLHIKNKFKSFFDNKIIKFICIFLYILISLNAIKTIVFENYYRNFIPYFTVNHYERVENNIHYNHRKDESNRKFKHRHNQIKMIEHKNIYTNNICLFEIFCIMIFFTGGTYFIFKIIDFIKKYKRF